VWARAGKLLRHQIRVASAFRSAGQVAELRRRASRTATHGIGEFVHDLPRQ